MKAILMEDEIDEDTVRETGDTADELTYTLFTEELDSPDEGKYIAYGIEVSNGRGERLKTVRDITCDRSALEELVKLCNELDLALCHLDDVVEDFLS